MMNEHKDDIDDLGARIAKIKSSKDEQSERTKKRSRHTGTQAGMEFVLSVLFGGYLGYVLDEHFQTAPLFLILLFFLGCGAGFMSIFRAHKKMGSAIGYSELHRKEKQGKTSSNNTDNVQKRE